MNRNIKMKINYLLILLICGVCFSCNEQQQEKLVVPMVNMKAARWHLPSAEPFLKRIWS